MTLQSALQLEAVHWHEHYLTLVLGSSRIRMAARQHHAGNPLLMITNLTAPRALQNGVISWVTWALQDKCCPSHSSDGTHR